MNDCVGHAEEILVILEEELLYGYEFGVRMIDYDGFYGSVVADVESDRLLGKIEGIDEDIVYEGRTVRECEQRFRVSRYKKK